MRGGPRRGRRRTPGGPPAARSRPAGRRRRGRARPRRSAPRRGTSRADRRRGSRRRARARRPAGVAQRAADVAGGQPRAGERAVCPQRHVRQVREPRELEALLARRDGSASRPSATRTATDSSVRISETRSRPVPAAQAAPRSRSPRAAATCPRYRRARPSIHSAGRRVACSRSVRRSNAAAASATRAGADGSRSAAAASAPHASAATSKTRSPIARASSRASLVWACASCRSQALSAVSASASRSRMRSGDGCAGRSPSATCSRRRASSWPPSHQSWLASATVSRGARRPAASRSASTSVARAPAVSPAAASASASRDCIAIRRDPVVGQQPQRRGVEACGGARRGRLQLARRRGEQRDRPLVPGAGRVLDVVGALDRRRRRGARARPPRARARPAASRRARRRRRRGGPRGGGTRSGAAPRSAAPARGPAARRARQARRLGELGHLVGELELERVAGDGRGVEQAPRVRAQRRELGAERGRDRRGHVECGRGARGAGELLEIERIAAGRGYSAGSPTSSAASSSLSGASRGGDAPPNAVASAGGSCPSRAATASSRARRADAAPAPRARRPKPDRPSGRRRARARAAGSPRARAGRGARGACGGGRPAPARPRATARRGQRGRVGRCDPALVDVPVQRLGEERVRQVGLELRRARLEHDAALGAAARCASRRDLPMPASPSKASTPPDRVSQRGERGGDRRSFVDATDELHVGDSRPRDR